MRVVERAVAMAKAGRARNRTLNIGAGTFDGGLDRQTLREPRGNR